MYPLLESLKLTDGLPSSILLPLHQERMDRSLQHFRGRPLDLASILSKENLSAYPKGVYKLRLEYGLEGQYRTDIQPYQPKIIRSVQAVEASHLDYTFKYSDRSGILDLQNTFDEILMHQSGRITDLSYANIALLQDREWFTPIHCQLAGVQREHLLTTGQIKPRDIFLNDLKDYTHFRPINALLDLETGPVYPVSMIRFSV